METSVYHGWNNTACNHCHFCLDRAHLCLLDKLSVMECYTTHLGLWRAIIYYRKLWLPLPLPPLFSPDLAKNHAHSPCKARQKTFLRFFQKVNLVEDLNSSVSIDSSNFLQFQLLCKRSIIMGTQKIQFSLTNH